MDLKIMILGDNSVGKSSLLAEKFYAFTKDTLGPDMTTRKFTVEDKILTVQFWDMPGRRDQRSCIIPYYRGTNCCVLVYDVSSLESFETLEHWRKEFLAEIALPDEQWFPFVVIGNKIDLDDREVTQEQAKSWCIVKEVHSYYEISAKDSTNVSIALQKVVQSALAYNNKSIMHDKRNQKNSRCCCCGLFSRIFH